MTKPRFKAFRGGEMPIAGELPVVVLCRDGEIFYVGRADNWNHWPSWWKRESRSCCDIIAYRVIEQE